MVWNEAGHKNSISHLSTYYIPGARLITLYPLFYSFWVLENLKEASKKQFFKELVVEN